MTFITRQDCAYHILRDMYELYDLTKPNYLADCEDCNGKKECCINLDQLIELHEFYKNEFDIGSLL